MLDHGRIELAGAAFVYLQRTLGGSESYGLAPAAELAPGDVVASVAAGEAIWVGFQALDRDRPATIAVEFGGSPARDPVTLTCPPEYCLPGPNGCAQFRAGDELSIAASGPAAAEARVRLLAPEDFTSLTGIVPDPLDPDSAYGGWLLP